jgi:hypothetical protein
MQQEAQNTFAPAPPQAHEKYGDAQLNLPRDRHAELAGGGQRDYFV